jgi:hypothetical protein
MALQVFQTARAALESTRGTDLTPTRIIYGESFTHNHEVATIRPEELRNSYEGFFSAAAGPEKSTLEIGGRVSYDDLIWYGNLFFKAVASGTGAGADKTWTFTPSNTTDDVKTATVQLGYSDTIATAPGVKLNYVFGDELNLHWEKNDDGAATFKANFLTAKAMTQITAFTGSLSDRTVTLASANNTSVFIDTATIGSTADPLVTALDFTLNLNPVPFYALDGTTTAREIYRPAHRTWKATVTRQYNVATHLTAFQNKTVQKIRCRTLGPSLGGSNYKIDLDMYGVWTERAWADVDGIITEELTLEPVFDTTTSTSHSLVVVNATASIT